MTMKKRGIVLLMLGVAGTVSAAACRLPDDRATEGSDSRPVFGAGPAVRTTPVHGTKGEPQDPAITPGYKAKSRTSSVGDAEGKSSSAPTTPPARRRWPSQPGSQAGSRRGSQSGEIPATPEDLLKLAVALSGDSGQYPALPGDQVTALLDLVLKRIANLEAVVKIHRTDGAAAALGALRDQETAGSGVPLNLGGAENPDETGNTHRGLHLFGHHHHEKAHQGAAAPAPAHQLPAAETEKPVTQPESQLTSQSPTLQPTSVPPVSPQVSGAAPHVLSDSAVTQSTLPSPSDGLQFPQPSAEPSGNQPVNQLPETGLVGTNGSVLAVPNSSGESQQHLGELSPPQSPARTTLPVQSDRYAKLSLLLRAVGAGAGYAATAQAYDLLGWPCAALITGGTAALAIVGHKKDWEPGKQAALEGLALGATASAGREVLGNGFRVSLAQAGADFTALATATQAAASNAVNKMITAVKS